MRATPGPINPIAISLVLPAWNESEVIARAIAEADTALRQITLDYEIIVVDDGSVDGTAKLVEQVSADNAAVRLVRHDRNLGYGASLRSGFAAAEKDWVVFTDADCQFDLTELDRFVLLSDRYDIVCGYRIDRKDSALRCLYSKVYNQLVGVLLRTGVRDVDCALKMFPRDLVQTLEITGDGFLVNSELLTQARLRGHSVVEVGVSHRPRTEGHSTVSIRHIPKVLASLARFWWNAVQFPASSAVHSGGPAAVNAAGEQPVFSERQAGRLQWALLLIASIFLLTNLSYPLIDRDETRYAEIPREILATGNWVLPQLNFQTYYDKPPLLYWLCAISYKLFGVSEAAARLVPALAALATLAATMWFGSRTFGKQVGLLSGVVLLLSVGFVFASRYLLLDGLLALLVALSLFTAHEAIRGDKLKISWWLLSGVCVGLAFLTKGPLAFVLWLPPVFAYAWLSDSCAKPRWWHYSLIGLVAAAVVSPWLIAVSQQDPNFLTEFFVTHNVKRFAGEFHSKPIWYFIPVLLIAGHPWCYLTIPFARFLFGQAAEVRTQRPPAVGFLLLWSGWCFVFFSLSKCKLPTYLLPLAPALALMIGQYLEQVLRATSDPGRHWFARFWSARGATASTCFAGVGFVAYIVLTQSDVSIATYLWALTWTGMLVCAITLLGDQHQANLAWATSSGVAFLLAVMVMHQMVPAYSRSQTLFGAESPLGKKIAVESKPAMATVAHEFSEVPFYLKRSDIPNFSNLHDRRLGEFVRAQDRAVLIIDKEVTVKQLRSQLPQDAKLKLLGERGPARLVEVRPPRPSEQLAARPTAAANK